MLRICQRIILLCCVTVLGTSCAVGRQVMTPEGESSLTFVALGGKGSAGMSPVSGDGGRAWEASPTFRVPTPQPPTVAFAWDNEGSFKSGVAALSSAIIGVTGLKTWGLVKTTDAKEAGQTARKGISGAVQRDRIASDGAVDLAKVGSGERVKIAEIGAESAATAGELDLAREALLAE